jgi:hydrogenase maturation protease
LRVHVIGVGTGHGDDAAGLAVAEALAAHPLPCGVAIHRCARPLPDLLDALEGADAAVIVDAARTGAEPGHVSRIAREDLACPGAASSHGIGVAQALRLAEALGRAPGRVELLAVEIPAPGTGRALSPQVRRAVPRAVERVLEIVREIRGLQAASSRGA